jgi:hypothetical protein
LKTEIKNLSAKLERATGIEPVLPAWESKLSTLYFQHLQNRPIKICVHALHTVHALPDLRIAAGRFAGRFLARDFDHFGDAFGDRQRPLTGPEKARVATV